MRNGIIACVVLLTTGCADFNFSVWPSILNATDAGAGSPKHLGRHQSTLTIEATRSELRNAYQDALLILGFSDIRHHDNVVAGDRRFIMGFVCGVGGETLSMKTEHVAGDRYSVTVVSYKKFPYPSSTRFLDEDFLDVLVQLLDGGKEFNAS